MKNTPLKELEKKIFQISRKKPIELSEPNLSLKDINEVTKELRLNNLAIGKSLKKFKFLLSKYTKAKNIALCSNGTLSIYAALLADNTIKNNEVLIPSLNYIASLNAILALGGIPHFVESHDDDLGVDFYKLEKYLKKNTIIKNKKCINIKTGRQIKSLIITHVFGHPNNPILAKKICKKFKITFIEDASEALGSFYKGKHLGTFGDFGVLSFNGNKIITSGGGGAVFANSLSKIRKIYKIIDNGKIKHKTDFIYDEFGLNLKMPNINAAIAINQLKQIEKKVKLRRNLFKFYNNISSEDFKFFKEPFGSRSNYWLQAIKVKSEKDKKTLMNFFQKKRIKVRSIWKPLHLFKHLKKYPRMKIKKANSIYKKTFNITSSPKINL